MEITQTKWTFWRRWFVRYYYNSEEHRIEVERGLISRHVDYEELLYFNDVKYNGNWKERILGYGDVILLGQETSTKELTLHNIKFPRKIAEYLNNVIQEAKKDNLQRVQFLSVE